MHKDHEPAEGLDYFLKKFSDPEMIARYEEGPPRFVPGFDALHRMTAILLAEHAPTDARVLVLGAGGGLELKALTQAQPDWSFVGVDPAGPMLDLAARTLGPLMERIELVKGYIDDVADGPFDAGICLLTLHFLKAEERLRTLQEIRRRLRPAAPFVAAHASCPQAERSTWIARYAAYALASGADAKQVAGAHKAVEASLCLFEPARDEALMREAGFTGIALFYAAFTWRGWIAYA